MNSSPESRTSMSPKRFALELPIEFRPQHDFRWWPGKTENISANGILFSTHKRLLPLTPIEIALQLPAALTGDSPVRVLCLGYVVRTIEPQLPSDEVQLAATFVDYRLVSSDAGPSGELRRAQLLASRGDVATLAHRLNTMLSVIMGNAELLLLDAGNEARVRAFCLQTRQVTHEAATLLGSLVTVLRSSSATGFHLPDERSSEQHVEPER